MAILSLYRITNRSIMVDEEMPSVVGFAKDPSDLIEETGSEERAASTKVEVVWRNIRMGKEDQHEDLIHARS